MGLFLFTQTPKGVFFDAIFSERRWAGWHSEEENQSRLH